MGAFVSKAATEESTAGLVKMDDIASVRAITPSRTAAGGGGRIAPLAGKREGVLHCSIGRRARSLRSRRPGDLPHVRSRACGTCGRPA